MDVERATIALDAVGGESAPAKLRTFADTARQRLRGPDGGYRRDHLRALAQRVEVADGEVRTMGSRGNLLRTLAAAGGVKSAAGGAPSFVPSWRREGDSNPRYIFTMYNGLANRRLQPLGHPSVPASQSRTSAQRTSGRFAPPAPRFPGTITMDHRRRSFPAANFRVRRLGISATPVNAPAFYPRSTSSIL